MDTSLSPLGVYRPNWIYQATCIHIPDGYISITSGGIQAQFDIPVTLYIQARWIHLDHHSGYTGRVGYARQPVYTYQMDMYRSPLGVYRPNLIYQATCIYIPDGYVSITTRGIQAKGSPGARSRFATVSIFIGPVYPRVACATSRSKERMAGEP